MPTDAELLQRYARYRDEVAFAEVVRTHIDLVYSAAARRVGGDPHAAAEVTQEVFLSLARHAGRLAQHPVLSAWLHTCTRNAAANLLRRERRHAQHLHEAQAMQENYSAENLDHAWRAVRGELDAALDELGEADRQALVLRFFENQSYSALGARLGLREEAARMRVGRALEKLRSRLERRGIASTAALLGGALTAHGVAGAPAGLAASVSATVAATSIAAPALGLFYLMSTAKIAMTLVGIAALAGVSVYVYQRNPVEPSAHAATVSTLAPSTPTATPPAPTRTVTLPATVRLPEAPVEKLTEGGAKVAALRDILARLPEQRIPELALATEGDWYSAVDTGPLESAEDIRLALGRLRSAAERRFATLVQPALRAYVDANGGQFPGDPVQLQPLVDPKVARAMLERYRVAPASAVPNVRMGGDFILTQKSLIDTEYDNHSVIGPNGTGAASGSSPASQAAAALIERMARAHYSATGKPPGSPADLLPYATTPEQRAAVEHLSRKMR